MSIEKNEIIAIKRFFSGEQPKWSHFCIDPHDSPSTAGYGKLGDYGDWEFPLPDPVEQWSKKKDHDIVVKINGMKYKARIIPFDSREIIKRNFVHHKYAWNMPADLYKSEYDLVVKQLRETKDASHFIVTQSAGDCVSIHPTRLYLEIVDSTWPIKGGISNDLYRK